MKKLTSLSLTFLTMAGVFAAVMPVIETGKRLSTGDVSPFRKVMRDLPSKMNHESAEGILPPHNFKFGETGLDG